MANNTKDDVLAILEDERGAIVNLENSGLSNSFVQGPSSYYLETAELDNIEELPDVFTAFFHIVFPIMISVVAVAFALEVTGYQQYIWA